MAAEASNVTPPGSAAHQAAELLGARRQREGGALYSPPWRGAAGRNPRRAAPPGGEGRAAMKDQDAEQDAEVDRHQDEQPEVSAGEARRTAPHSVADGDSATDAALLARFAAGDARAARALIERHSGRVLALANRMLGDAAEAEDVAQEAMVRIWRAAAGWEDRGARVSTWLHRVTLNLCYDRLRKKRGLPLEAAPEPEDPAPTAEARLTEASLEADLMAAIQELPDRQRAAIHLRHFEGRSNPEIAEALEVSVEAVESLLARGRRALKAQLARRDEEE